MHASVFYSVFFCAFLYKHGRELKPQDRLYFSWKKKYPVTRNSLKLNLLCKSIFKIPSKNRKSAAR